MGTKPGLKNLVRMAEAAEQAGDLALPTTTSQPGRV